MHSHPIAQWECVIVRERAWLFHRKRTSNARFRVAGHLILLSDYNVAVRVCSRLQVPPVRCKPTKPYISYVYDYAYYYEKKNARPDVRMNKATSSRSRRNEENDNIQITCCRCIIMHARVGLFDIKHNDVLCVPHARINTSPSHSLRGTEVLVCDTRLSISQSMPSSTFHKQTCMRWE